MDWSTNGGKNRTPPKFQIQETLVTNSDDKASVNIKGDMEGNLTIAGRDINNNVTIYNWDGDKINRMIGAAKDEILQGHEITAPEETIASKLANLFWFVADIRWVQIVIALSQGEKTEVMHYLSQAHHHADEIGLDSEITGRILHLIDLADAHPYPHLMTGAKQEHVDAAKTIYAEVSAILAVVGREVQEQQSAFSAYPTTLDHPAHRGNKGLR